jgi:hypothetical protein
MAAAQLTLAFKLQLFFRAIAGINLSGILQFLKIPLIKGGTLGLFIGGMGAAHPGPFVPLEAKPVHDIQEIFACLIGGTDLIRILDSKNKNAARMTGVKPIIKGRAHVPQV